MSELKHEILEGSLQRVIFKNDSGFIIGAFMDKNNNPFTALGNMINPETGMDYILTGKWQENARYGDQLKFHAYETVMPSDINGIFKYIVRTCKFVGGKIGNDIVDKYGEKTLEIMKTNPILLSCEIKGITMQRAKEIQTILLENEKNEKIMIELESMLDIPGMRTTLPAKLIEIYKSNAAEVVKDNPYILTSFRGVNFILADRVALNIGFARDSIERKKSAARHVLSENMRNGSVWMYKDECLIGINALIQVSNCGEGLTCLVEEGVLVKDNDYFAFDGPAGDEMLIAEKIIEMINFRKE